MLIDRKTLNSVRISVLPNLIQRFNIISIKNLSKLFVKEAVSKVYKKRQRKKKINPRIATI